MDHNQILHILRNPYGHSTEDVRKARNAAADLIEALEPVAVMVYRDAKLLTISRNNNHELRIPTNVYVTAYVDRRDVPSEARGDLAKANVARLFQPVGV